MTIEFYISKFGNMFWSRNRENHNNYGPSSKWDSGSKYWYVNGDPHRVDGPAIEYFNGDNEYWVNGVKYHDCLEYLVAIEEYKLSKEHI